jgi:Mrp family chromosome partitioning ATPase
LFSVSFVAKVPCVAVVENMCYFDADGKRYYPFGQGSGTQASNTPYHLFCSIVLLDGC